MAASKANYVIIYRTSAQVYAATSLATAVNTPLPKGCKMEDRMILLASYLPDEESLCVYLLGEEDLKLKEPKPKEVVAENESADADNSDTPTG